MNKEQQIPFSTSKGRFLAVLIPERAEFEFIQFDESTAWIRWMTPDWSDNGNIDLPPGSYTFLCTTDTVTEDEAKEIVELIKSWHNPIYENYTAKCRDYRDIIEAAFKTALESFSTLLQANNIDNGNWAILKQN